MDTTDVTKTKDLLAARSGRLLDMPNEVLLRIVACIDFSSNGIVSLRLVNHHLDRLLTDPASLKQLQNDIADFQYPLANSFRTTLGDHSWSSLQELKEDTAVVARMIERIQKLESDIRLSEAAEPAQLKPWLESTKSSHEDTELLTVGLHLLAALHRAKIGPSELESAWFLVALGPAATALMRFTSVHLRDSLLVRATRGQHEAWKSAAERSSAPLALEDLIVQKGLLFAEDLLKESTYDAQSFSANGPWTVFDAQENAIDSTTNILLSEEAPHSDDDGELNQLYDDTIDSHFERSQIPSWSVLANDLLLFEYMGQHPLISEDDDDDDVKWVCTFYAEAHCRTPFTHAEIERWREEDDAYELEQIVQDVLTADFYAFVEAKLGVIMSRAIEAMEKKGGCSSYVTKAFQLALEKKDIIPEETIRETEGLAPHRTFLKLFKKS